MTSFNLGVSPEHYGQDFPLPTNPRGHEVVHHGSHGSSSSVSKRRPRSSSLSASGAAESRWADKGRPRWKVQLPPPHHHHPSMLWGAKSCTCCCSALELFNNCLMVYAGPPCFTCFGCAQFSSRRGEDNAADQHSWLCHRQGFPWGK